MGKKHDKEFIDKLDTIRGGQVGSAGSSDVAALYAMKHNGGGGADGPTDHQADDYMKQADRMMKDTITKVLFMTNNKKWRKASDLYLLAAGQYQFAVQYSHAGDAYEKAGELLEKLKDHEVDAAQAYNNAGNNYVECGEFEKAAELYNFAVSIYVEQDQHQAAARVLKNQADMMSEHADDAEAQSEQIDGLYIKAADLYADNDQYAHAVDCYAIVAQSCTKRHDYATAIDLYSKCGNICLDHTINKGMEKQYYYYVLLCSMCIDCKSDAMEMTKSYLSDFVGKQRQLDGAREFKFVRQLIDAFEEFDLNKFTSHIYQYNRIKSLNDSEAALLLVVKNVLKNGNQLPSLPDIPVSDDDEADADADINHRPKGVVKYDYSDDDDDSHIKAGKAKHIKKKIPKSAVSVYSDDDDEQNESKKQPVRRPTAAGQVKQPRIQQLSINDDERNSQLKGALFAKSATSKLKSKSANVNDDERTLSDIEREIEVEMQKASLHVDENDTMTDNLHVDNNIDDEAAAAAEAKRIRKQKKREAKAAAALAAQQAEDEAQMQENAEIEPVDDIVYEEKPKKHKKKKKRDVDELTYF